MGRGERDCENILKPDEEQAEKSCSDQNLFKFRDKMILTWEYIYM